MFRSLVSNGNLILLFFYMGVNSITAIKLPAIVPKILHKREAFLSGRFLRLSSSSLFIFNPLTPVPPVTAREEPWRFFHF